MDTAAAMMARSFQRKSPRAGLPSRFSVIGTTPDDAAGGDLAGGLYQELQKPHPDYAKVSALAAVGLMEALREVSAQIAELGHQVMLASRR
jgi:hypothetical protein